MFRKGEKVIYPRHGAGKIIEVQEHEVEGKKQRYYKIQFINSSVTVSIPANKAKELGLRSPLSKTELKKVLKDLNKIVKINRKTLTTLDNISREKLGSGKMEDVVDLVNLLKSLAKQKEEENKNFSYSYSDRLEIAEEFIKSEIELVLGKNALKKYGFEK
jgi:CarD family transcriptional regulator